MADVALRLPQNVAGDFFVDESCIDCATCRIVAPGTFAYHDDAGRSVVRVQPATDEDAHRAQMALVACPTSSIGSASKAGAKDAARSFPDPVGRAVYYCGFASESSYGASSWLVVRPEGNVLVDSPRAARPLLGQIEALGGVRTMVLSHKDDVADHDVFARHFGCERVMHAADVGPRTQGIERRLEGNEPIALAHDLTIIPVPGHTRGSVALLFGDVLFTGDHLWGLEGERGLGAGRSVCWYSWAEQTRSMERLLGYDFTWVLPGHGVPFRADTAAEMREELERLVGRMRPPR